MPNVSDPMIDETISHYRVLSQLGSGGMGVVYEAEDTRLGRHVALKLLSPEACCDRVAMERFLREARIVSSLSHPHICTLHDIGTHDGQQFMVMELLEGESLKQRIGRGALRLDDLLELGVQIADALDAAHSHNVIHRDIKPANLFITRRGQAKVLDFGVAKLAEAERDQAGFAETNAAFEVTTTGSAVGTIGYMSPEQARGQGLDARSDLFSFGIVLYEMATGRQPFVGATPAVVFEAILTKDPIPPSQINANVPQELDRIVAKALDKDCETRYQSAAEIRADLKRLKRETETGRTLLTHTSPAATAAAARVAEKTTTRRALYVGVPLATVAAIAAAVLWQSQRTPALAERDPVVLADFTNRTGDTMFDDTLSEALAVQLRQSPFLNLLPEQQTAATLRLMGRDATTALTPEIAREVCQRTGAKATLGGSIASLGSSYVITLRALDCVSGSTLAEEQVQATSKEEVLGALGSAASQFRERLGESLSMVQRYDTRVEQATTPSLEALKAYSQGTIVRRTQGDAESLPFYRRAIELDPDFALAHARLGTVLSNVGERAEAEKATTRAHELGNKVSERERLYIEARYHTTVTRDQDKAIEAYRLLTATYPDDFGAHANLGGLYRGRGMLKEAIASLEQAVRLAPDEPLPHMNLAAAYLDEERFLDARREFEETIKLRDTTSARAGLFVTAIHLGDQALADAQLAAVRGRRDEHDMLPNRIAIALLQGRNREAAELSAERLQRLRSSSRLEFSGESFLVVALGHALVGRDDLARAQLDRIREEKLINDGTTDELVVLGGLLRDKRLAETYLDPSIAQLQTVVPPEGRENAERMMRVFAALAAGDYPAAYDLAARVNLQDVTQHWTVFAAGLAAIELQRWDDGIRFFEALQVRGMKLATSGLPGNVRINLARAYAASGRIGDARKNYEEAFQIWKNADADLPLLVEARREYAALGS
jgi:eukaryotic-like serine/threonine-protein kinase